MPKVLALSIGIAAILVLGIALVGISAAAPIHPADRITPASGSSEQRAFGGSASSSFSCAAATCFGPGANVTGNLTLSWQYSVNWAVIYTITNVSGSQTEIEIQGAVSASASIGVTTCVGIPHSASCEKTSIGLNVKGLESSIGYTNITSGTVDQTNASAGPVGSTAALAIMNSWSKVSLNFSGSYSATIPTSATASESASASFDIGGSETSAVTFGTPLGIVPVDPVTGDNWTANSTFDATGNYVSGASYSVSVNGSTPVTNSTWTHGSVNPSGTLYANGTDLGPVTLYDNYTTPAQVITAQDILLTFAEGNYTAEDGWIVVPVDLYGGLLGLTSIAAVNEGSPSPALHGPAATTVSSTASSERAYYRDGPGIVGVAETGNTSLPGSEPGADTPSVQVQAGPEPVSVAEKQYQSILSSGPAASGFPILWLVLGAVAAVVVIGGVLFWRRSAHRGRPPTSTPAGATSGGAGAGASSPPAQPPMQP